MKVCYISQSFYPYVGGVSDYLRDLGRELTNRGMEVHELTFKTHETPEYEEFEGIKVHRFLRDRSIELLEGYGKFKENVLKVTHGQRVKGDVLARREYYGFEKYWRINERARKKLLRLHRKEKFDILHVQDFQFLPLGHLLEKDMHIPIAFTWHIPFIQSIPKDWKHFFVRYMDDYDCCVFSTDEYVKNAKDSGLPNEKCLKIHPFVDLRRYKPENRAEEFKKKYGLEENTVILCVSRLDPRKGQETLIKALPKVVKEFPEVKAVFVGNGSMTKRMLGGRSRIADKLRRLAREKGIEDNVLFTGYVSEDDLKGAFEAAYVTVQPSLMEAFGLTVAQAMSFAKPVIGTDVGGIKVQVSEGKTGFLFNPKDFNFLSLLLIFLLKNPNVAKEMGKKGEKRIEKIADVKIGLENHLRLYDKLK
jgi:glycosyltransferase involved in cell wall biosynthesis